MTTGQWQVSDLAEVRARLGGEAVQYLEFLKVPSMNCGVYFLPAGSKDMQSYHDDDELYVVLEGHARMRLDGNERAIGPGSVLYVGAETGHQFFEIDEDMTLLVVFASGAR